jgi:hypothetical protein
MKTVNYGKSKWLNSPLSLSLCLVIVCLITTGANGVSGGSSGNEPTIKLFEADHSVLDDSNFAMYKFVVKHATEIEVIEAGNTIKAVNNPSAHTLKGTVYGMPANAIQTGGSNTFEAVLYARNDSGEVEKRLTLSFATAPPPPPAPPPADSSSTAPVTPQWGEQYSSPRSTQPATSTTDQLPWPPDFARCPSNCPYCLTPDKAKSRGFTQKCLDQPCYYSPDNQQKWYCYSEPEGWCCVGGHGGQVSQATKTECTQMSGDWYADQSQAMQACQETCWCCRQDGAVGNVTVNECLIVGTCYATQFQARQACQELMPCWCCVNGQVGQISQTQCIQMGGCCHNTQAEAVGACQPAWVPPGDGPPPPSF